MPKHLTAAAMDTADDEPPATVRQRRRDDGRAFMPDVEPGYAHSGDSLAENLAEAYLESATSGEERGEDLMNEFVPEDIGGPFLEEEPPDEDEGEDEDENAEQQA